MRRLNLVVPCVCLTLAAAPFHRARAAAACPDTINIGLTTVLSTDVALLGVEARNGVQEAITEINAAGGLAGKPAKLIAEDTGMSGAGAINALNRVLEDKPLVVYSTIISPLVFAQSDIIKQSATPTIVAATNAGVTNQGIPWLFRIHVHDGQLAEMLPTYVVKTMHKSKPAILVVADDFGLGAQKGLAATFTKLGFPPVALASYGGSDKDMSAQLLGIQDKGADVIVLFGRPTDVTIVMKQVKDLGLDIPIVGNASIAAPTVLDNLTADEANGGIGIGGMIPQPSKDPKVQAWASRMLATFKVPGDNFAVGYYDSVWLLKSIIDKVGCDKVAIRDGLAATKDFKGLMISYTADARGDLAHTAGVYQNKGKTPELIGSVSEAGF
jgi:branched-chain amino acid transport system substrate-binding protein